MEAMPVPPPTGSTDVLRTFGIPPLRAGIIQATQRRGAATAQDLMEDLQVSRTTLIPHTQALVDAGILVQQLDPAKQGARAGFNRLVWRVDPQVLAQQLEQLRGLLAT